MRIKNLNYEIKLRSGKGKSDVVHVGRMKPFRERNNDDFATDTDSEDDGNPLTTMSKRGSSEDGDLNGGSGVLTPSKRGKGRKTVKKILNKNNTRSVDIKDDEDVGLHDLISKTAGHRSKRNRSNLSRPT